MSNTKCLIRGILFAYHLHIEFVTSAFTVQKTLLCPLMKVFSPEDNSIPIKISIQPGIFSYGHYLVA
jgi:hypothetical protein